jgi:hypothetical protein
MTADISTLITINRAFLDTWMSGDLCLKTFLGYDLKQMLIVKYYCTAM